MSKPGAMVVLCPYCGGAAVFEDSAAVYRGKSYGMIWHCRPCGAYVGVHKAGTYRYEAGVRIDHTGTEPLGRLADARTRRARKQAHEVFDGLWLSGRMKRGAAYAWLQAATGLPPERCHISHMDAKQCALVIERSRAWLPAALTKKPKRDKRPKPNSKPGVATPRRDASLPDCGCVHEPPWADCAHTEPELDGAELAHMRNL